MSELPLDIARSIDPLRAGEIADALNAFPSWLRARGEDYALAGRVSDERLEDDALCARVRGTHVYAVRWTFLPNGVDPLCSCPSGPVCKHAYAVGLRLVGALAAAGLPLEGRRARLLPAAWRTGRPAAPASLARGAAAPSEGRSDSRLGALREAGNAAARLAAANGLLWKLGISPFDLAPGALDDVIHEPDADVRCWRLAHAVAAAKGEAPKPLAAWAAREDLATRAAESTRRHVVERLSNWADQPHEPRHLRVVLGLAHGASGAAHVTIEARYTGPRAADEPRSAAQIGSLAAELRRDGRLLSPPQARLLRLLAEPEMLALLASARRPGELANEHLNLLLDRAVGLPFVTWARELPPDLAAQGGVKPGSRVRLDGDDLKLALECRARGEELELGLALRAEDGEPRPLTEALLWSPDRHRATTNPTVALVDGAFHRVTEEPPADITRMIGELHGVPLRREDGPMLDRLASRFDSVAAALRAMTRTHDAAPVVLLDLRESDWLCVRVFAHTAARGWYPGAPRKADELVFEHAPDTGWVVLDDPAAAAVDGGAWALESGAGFAADDADLFADGPGAPGGSPAPVSRPRRAAGPAGSPWREVPDPAPVAPALEWLELLGAARGDRRGAGGLCPEPDAARGWWLRLGVRTAEKLNELWRERPRAVAWFGNRAARELLAGHRRVRARLSVTASGPDWLGVKAEWESEGLALTESDLARLRGSRDAFVRLTGGWVRRDAAEAHDAVADALADLGLEADGREQRLTLWQLAQVRPESFDALADAGADDAARATVARIREAIAAFEGIPAVEPPAGLAATLRPYQRHGLDFLAWTSSLGAGAVLADDMGLGKTVQALAWLLRLRDQDPEGGPSLVVCPASVAHNWAREAARFTPGLKVMVLGSGRERHAMMREAAAYDIVITNYALLRRDIAHWRGVELRAAVLDEAQNIKNPDAAVARAALELRAKHRIALTGTPLENRALDLWSIMAFVLPGHLGPRARFVARYDRPDAPPFARRLLAARLRPAMLRRLKEQVERDLPSRIEERLDCEMSAGQRKFYLAELVQARKLLGTVVRDEEGLARRRIIILSVLTRLRQICCHPALVGGDKALGSGKLDALFELLEPLRAEGQKVLVFSQFVRCLELIAEALGREGVPYHMLTGRTSTRARQAVVDAFTRDPEPSVFLVSLKAGGTGLNLTAANHVVLFDPWWNPAVEAQAIDRTHRIGQTRSVVAYRLYAEGTVEERIAELQARKAALARDVLGEDGFARTLTREDLEFLLAD